VTLTAGGTGGGYQQNPYLFKGGIQDRTTGLVKFGGRWYNPTTGTWTQQDTLDTPLNLANANRYAYAGNDPINNLDPSGQGCGLDWFLTGVAFVGLAVSVFSGPGVLAGIGLAAALIGTGGGAISILADGCI
jgi:RHS repeat-associated protein